MTLRLLVVLMLLSTAAALGLIAYRTAVPPTIISMTQAPSATAPNTLQLPVTVGYIVTAHPLPAGTLTRDDDFKVRTVPAGEMPQDAIAMGPDVMASIRGALVRRYLDAGATVTMPDILRPRDRGFLAAVLAPGTRAVSVGVDAVTGVAGLIWPGDRVDVILTQELDQTNAPIAKRVVSETALTDIRVIAIDQEIVQGGADSAAVAGKIARTVTLQVDHDQAERLTVAQRLGHLALAIRAMVDSPDEPMGRTPVFSSDVSPTLFGAGQNLGAHVQVIQGDKTMDVTFR